MTRRRVLLGIAGAVVLLMGGAALYVRHSVSTIWGDLRTAARVTLPSGYTVVDRDERGTALCLISCTGEGEAQILLTVAGPRGTDPCADLKPALAGVASGVTSDPPLGTLGCLYGELPGGGRGFVTVTPQAVPGIDGCAGDRAPCALVRFSSGVE